LKIVEGAGFTPDAKINLVEEYDIQKGKPFSHTEAELERAISMIQGVLQ
jgi:hypothetical protein